MEFIMQVCGAMLAVAGSLIVLCIACIATYTVIIGLDTALDERKKRKKTKANKRGGKK